MRLSRRKFIALGSSTAAASFLAACGTDSGTATEDGNGGRVEIASLNNLLALEYVEAGFYTALVKSKIFSAKASKALGKFGEEEEEHVEALAKAIEHLGGEPAPKLKTRFSLQGETEALEIASTLENVGAAAYLGQLPTIGSEGALDTILSIHSVEGRHAAAIDDLLGNPTTPDGAFAKPATMDEAVEAVEPFVAS